MKVRRRSRMSREARMKLEVEELDKSIEALNSAGEELMKAISSFHKTDKKVQEVLQKGKSEKAAEEPARVRTHEEKQRRKNKRKLKKSRKRKLKKGRR